MSAGDHGKRSQSSQDVHHSEDAARDMGDEKKSELDVSGADDNDDPSLTDDMYAVERGEKAPEPDDSFAGFSEVEGSDVSATTSSDEDDGKPDASEENASEPSSDVPASVSDSGIISAEENDEPEDDSDEEDEDELSESRMPLTAHLLDLRKRMVRSFIAVAVGFLGCYPFSKELFGYLMEPMALVLKTGNFIYTYPPEAFFTYIKVSLVAGVFATSPFIFYQMWQFIAPGLYEHERKILMPIAFLSAVFFVSGACFGYFVVFPFGFEFFASFSTENIVFMPKLSEYLGFALKLLFAFGVVFEMPIFVLFLAKLGMCSAKGMRRFRKYAILLAFVVSAILTPPDVITQTLMAGPLILLYEISIFVAAIFGKKEKPIDPTEDEDEASDGREADAGEATDGKPKTADATKPDAV